MRLCLLLLPLSLSLASCHADDEPMAGNKPLSFWKKEARQVSFFSFWNSSKDERRNEAFRRLSEIGEPAVPALLELLKENRIPVSGDAFNALANLGPRARSAVPELRKILKQGKRESQRRAAWILGTIGPAAEPAVPDLAPLMRHADPRLREVTAEALGKIGGAGQAALDHALTSASGRDREAAISGMAGRKLDLESRRRLIEAGLADPDPLVRERTVRLMSVDRNEADSLARHLVMALNDPDPRVNRSAQTALTMHLQRGGPSPRFLAAVLGTNDPGARADVAWRLGSSDWPHGQGFPFDDVVQKALLEAVSDSHPPVRVYVARALAYRGGPSAEIGIQMLRREIPKVEPILGVRAARTLWDLAGKVSDVQQAYDAGLRDPEKWNRVETISAISAMGKAGRRFEPQLEGLLNDPDGEVRDRAGKILYHFRAMASTQ